MVAGHWRFNDRLHVPGEFDAAALELGHRHEVFAPGSLGGHDLMASRRELVFVIRPLASVQDGVLWSRPAAASSSHFFVPRLRGDLRARASCIRATIA